jgi:hypothetical protein
MILQSLSQDTAQNIWNLRRSSEAVTTFETDSLGEGDQTLSDLDLDEVVEDLKEIEGRYAGKNLKSHGGKVDADIVEIIHSRLSEYGEVRDLSHIGFWRWLSNAAYDGYFWEFINWRLEGSKEVINWGITGPANLVEVYFARAWLRGHKMVDHSLADPYEYAKKGGSEVWRSQILRQDFGRDREFVKAFLDTIYDASGRTVIGANELRKQLIPEIRIWTSTATFTHLTYEESLELLASFRQRGN